MLCNRVYEDRKLKGIKMTYSAVLVLMYGTKNFHMRAFPKYVRRIKSYTRKYEIIVFLIRGFSSSYMMGVYLRR